MVKYFSMDKYGIRISISRFFYLFEIVKLPISKTQIHTQTHTGQKKSY